ncbi:type II secretion system F family protein [Pontibacter sp. JAM-7]|uniref:type II secretion system F family protein n=1 Tax=Pontibacter sp. JAM-7 TaxID=3366581 RepID=UPI003AF95822
MPVFHYQAVTSSGEARAGQLEGADQHAVVAQLQSQGLIPLSVESGIRGFSLQQLLQMKVGGRQGLSEAKLLGFTRQLAALMQAGIALDRALQIMHRVTDDHELREVISPIQEGVRRGQSLSVVLEEQNAGFTNFYISMVQAAEVSGDLGQGLTTLASYMERSKILRDQVMSALIYPIILLLVSAISLLIILTYVVPQFEQLFSDMGRALPLSTQVVIGVAQFLQNYLPMILVIMLALFVYCRYLLTQPSIRLSWDRRKLSLPLFGSLIQRLETARFTRSLGTLVKGGVPLLRALSIAQETLSNRRLIEAVSGATNSLKEGRHLAAPLLATGAFPALAIQMMQVGEETGQLEEMLLKVADVFDQEVATAIQRMLAILTPALIVTLGVVIAGIIMSILVAIMSINQIPI